MSNNEFEQKPPRIIRSSDVVPVERKCDTLTIDDILARWRIVQHDVRNQLHTVASGLELLKYQLTYDPSKQEFIEDIEKIRRAMFKIEQLLLQNKLDQEFHLELEEINVLDLFKKIVEQIRSSQTQGKLNIILDESSLNLAIEGDRAKLEDVIMNIILNAYEAMSGKTGTLIVHAQQIDDMVNITLRDDGPGISLNVRDRLFSHGASTKNTKSRGIGLFGARCYIHLHKGSIEVLATVTKEELETLPPGTETGTTFMISLPKKQSKEIPEAREDSELEKMLA